LHPQKSTETVQEADAPVLAIVCVLVIYTKRSKLIASCSLKTHCTVKERV